MTDLRERFTRLDEIDAPDLLLEIRSRQPRPPDANPVTNAGEDASASRQPRSLRIIGWLTIVLGAWGVWDETIRLIRNQGVRWLTLVIAVASIAGGIGLLRRQRWGYLVTVAYFLSGILWGAWFFFLSGDYTVASRLWGVPVLLLASVPLFFLLSGRSRRWVRSAGA